MLTIDYGDLAPDLYAGRPLGTLRAYWKHRRMDGLQVFARFGLQDLTADVNFSDLISHGESLGWRTTGYRTQGEFISGYGSTKKGQPRESALGDEASTAFKVLEQTVGAD